MSSSIISPFPDLTALAILLALAQIVNIKPFAPAKEANDMSANAHASLMYVDEF